MADSTRKAEDAIDAIMEQECRNPADKLSELRYIASYAMARFYDLVTEHGTSATTLIDFATQNSLPPVTPRTQRRRRRKLVQQMKAEQEAAR